NPAHLTLARAVVRRRYVDGRANEVLLDQFDRIATRDGFQLRHGIVFWIDSDAAFGTPERHVDDRAFIGHKGRQSHHLVLVDQLAVADSALGWRHVLRMLYPPGVDYFQLIAATKWEAETVYAVARFNLLQQTLRVVRELGGVIEK